MTLGEMETRIIQKEFEIVKQQTELRELKNEYDNALIKEAKIKKGTVLRIIYCCDPYGYDYEDYTVIKVDKKYCLLDKDNEVESDYIFDELEDIRTMIIGESDVFKWKIIKP